MMNDLKSGHYLCEVRGIFNQGTYQCECYYDASLGKFLTLGRSSGNITRRVIRILKEMEDSENG